MAYLLCSGRLPGAAHRISLIDRRGDVAGRSRPAHDCLRMSTPKTAPEQSTPAPSPRSAGYLHGFTPAERDRLYRQARFLEHKVHDGLPYRRARQLIEVGCGVGAQTEILLRHFPDLHVTGVDASESNLAAARAHLA